MSKTFTDIIKKMPADHKKNILVGNGLLAARGYSKFSYSSICNNLISQFCYSSICNELINEIPNENYASLFKFIDTQIRNGSFNIEYFINLLDSFQHGLMHVCHPYEVIVADIQGLENRIKNDINILKRKTIEVLESEHSAIGEIDNFESCCKKLLNFDKVFTTNFDLVLPKLIIKANEAHLKRNAQKRPYFIDAFYNKQRYKIDASKYTMHRFAENWNHINIFYLHGAIHLLVDSQLNDTFKIVKGDSELSWIDLICTVKQLVSALDNKKNLALIDNNGHRIKRNFNNLLVFDGDAKQKRILIGRSSYLHKSLYTLQNITGSIIIYGCSLLNEKGNDLNNDEHIWNAIFENEKVKNIFIGIYSKDKSFSENKNLHKQVIMKRYSHLCDHNNTNVDFFDATKISIWDDNDSPC